ncbi:MAG: S24/S26 family peptidase [Pseudopelagicola sp.]|nr:S24/S26 family peptidase [Pseudopelagicola sp.]
MSAFLGSSANMEKEEILGIIEARLKDMGLTAGEASQQAVGNSTLISNIKRPRYGMPSFDNLSALAKVLDLELYFGPPRDITHAPEIEVDGHRFATVARHDACAAAGDGYVNFDEPPIDHLAFSKEWLLQNGIQPGKSVLINARGQSMEPSIYDSDLVMIDRRKREIRNGRIYVYNDPSDGTRIKRLELVAGHTIIVRSDNPDQKTWPPEYHTGPAMNAIAESIIGEVVWSGHKWS